MTSGRKESCLHASRLRDRVLYCIRSGHVRLPGGPGEMAKGHIRNCTSTLPDCWLIIRSYSDEALFHMSVQKFDPSSREYCDLMGNVDRFSPLFLNGAAFVLAVGVPIFPCLVGIAASLSVSW